MMMLHGVYILLLMLVPSFGQLETNSICQIKTNAILERTVSVGTSITISCQRRRRVNEIVVNEECFADRWILQLTDDTRYLVHNPQSSGKQNFEKDTGVTLMLSNTSSDTQCDGASLFIEYWLRLENINQNISGMIITCGVHRLDTLDEWYTSHLTKLIVENTTQGEELQNLTDIRQNPNEQFQTNSICQIKANAILERTVSVGTSITISCQRRRRVNETVVNEGCFADRWILQLTDNTRYLVHNPQSSGKQNFEKDTGVTLMLSNTDCDTQCDGASLFIEYWLRLENINQNISGMIIICGVHRLDTLDEWYASHSTKLIVENTTPCKNLTAIVQKLNETLSETMEQLGTCNKQLETCNMKVGTCSAQLKTCNESLGNITQVPANCSTGYAVSAVVAGVLGILVGIFAVLIIKWVQSVKSTNRVDAADQGQVFTNEQLQVAKKTTQTTRDDLGSGESSSSDLRDSKSSFSESGIDS